MTTQQYQTITAPLRRVSWGPPLIRLMNRLTTIAVYAVYILYLLYTLFFQPQILAIAIVVPFIGFVILTVVRDRIDAPRPYELLEIDPIITKGTKGHSFPSRHVFSVFIIATTISWNCLWLGILLFVIGLVICMIRILGGVHFPRDVIAGLVSGILGGTLGCAIISTIL